MEQQSTSLPAQAREDLAGNISGQFSPEDWERILARAQEQLAHSTWPDVIRDFHRQRYWGFVPNYKKPKVKREPENLGRRFLWYITRSFLLTKTVVLYFGARWTAGYGPINGYIFFGAICFMLCSYGLFLWRFRHHRDD